MLLKNFSHPCSGKRRLFSQNAPVPQGWLFIVAWRMMYPMCTRQDLRLETPLSGSSTDVDVVATETAQCWHHSASSGLLWRPKSQSLITTWLLGGLREAVSLQLWTQAETYMKHRRKKAHTHTHTYAYSLVFWREDNDVNWRMCLCLLNGCIAETTWDELWSVVNILRVCKHAVWKCLMSWRGRGHF